MMKKLIIAGFGCLGVVACANEPVSGTAAVQEKAANGDVQTEMTGFMGITGEVIKVENFESDHVIPRTLEIWLPPSYRDAPDKRYPVLYMHDGQNLFDPKQSQYSQTDWGVDEAMTRLIEEGKVREAIVVGNWSTHKRFNEYMPQKAVTPDNIARYRADFETFDADVIESDRYLKFLVEELKPYIDSTYRTLPGRADTSVMGSSMGGLISIYAISEYPDVFGGAGCVSTHFPLGDGAIVDYMADKLPDPSTHKIYFDYGTETLDHNYEGYQDRMDTHMQAAGFVEGDNWITQKFEGHEHSERAWRARVHIPLVFLLGSPKPGDN